MKTACNYILAPHSERAWSEYDRVVSGASNHVKEAFLQITPAERLQTLDAARRSLEYAIEKLDVLRMDAMREML